jgi:hypothetical protein
MSKQKSVKKSEIKPEVKEVEKMKEPKKSKKVSNSQKVTMIAFTGMKIGEFDVIRATNEKITVNTEKSGLMEFDAKTGLQTDAVNERFANKIVLE